MRRFLLLSVLVIGLLGKLSVQAGIEHLLPTPKQVTMVKGKAPVVLTGELHFAARPSERILAAFSNLLGQEAGESTTLPRVEINYVENISGAYDYPLADFPCEAYSLAVENGLISISAVTETGVIRAVQTLAQMAEGCEGEPRLDACRITDWPAFKVRGYMHDIGRSYISTGELMKQLRLMGRFKVNVLHLHLTENQAWRFEVKRYPQLTQAAAMTRFAGEYYTQDACREMVRLAAAYGITVIPEIDMPGHSAAFERAMGHSMQTEQGVQELKYILDEVMTVFSESPYIHIGADEQTITYPDFLKTMTDYIHEKGKRVIIWNPIRGVNITDTTGADMTQMWSTAGKKVVGLPNIDCRYNYVNHFDVFADVVGIYKSNIYYAQRGDAEIAGEITAVWNDRYVEKEADIMGENNVYANVLAATERAWKGGGKQYIDEGGTMLPLFGSELEEFADWERRFLFHKAHSLKDEPIPYIRQTNVRWRITDAFPNEGAAEAVFPPENEGPQESYVYQGRKFGTRCAIGAGVYLRHTWGKTVPAFYDNPQMNSTAYAWTYVFSPKDQTAGALIEFQNYGRSENDLAPADGQWDRKGSRIWLNDVEIPGPAWTNAGKTIDSEVPLGNENLSVRPPVLVKLKKGWNKVFLKLPYVKAPGVRLNKWMFTFVLTDTAGKNALEGVAYSAEYEE